MALSMAACDLSQTDSRGATRIFSCPQLTEAAVYRRRAEPIAAEIQRISRCCEGARICERRIRNAAHGVESSCALKDVEFDESGSRPRCKKPCSSVRCTRKLPSVQGVVKPLMLALTNLASMRALRRGLLAAGRVPFWKNSGDKTMSSKAMPAPIEPKTAQETPRQSAASSSTAASASKEVSHDECSRLAYSLWEKRGCPQGSAEQDWLEAEEQLRNS